MSKITKILLKDGKKVEFKYEIGSYPDYFHNPKYLEDLIITLYDKDGRVITSNDTGGYLSIVDISRFTDSTCKVFYDERIVRIAKEYPEKTKVLYLDRCSKKLFIEEDIAEKIKESVHRIKLEEAEEKKVYEFIEKDKKEEEERKRIEEEDKKEKERRNKILSSVKSVKSEPRVIYDEGGKTTHYTHTITCLDGEILKFGEVNIFDFGVVIAPMYDVIPGIKSEGIEYTKIDGIPSWRVSVGEKEYTRKLTENELNAFMVIVYLGKTKGIRM